jgi:hypothetical protein
MRAFKLGLTEDEIAVGRALLGDGAQFSIGRAKDGGPVVFVYVNGQHIATVGGRSPVEILRNLAHFAEDVRETDKG